MIKAIPYRTEPERAALTSPYIGAEEAAAAAGRGGYEALRAVWARVTAGEIAPVEEAAAETEAARKAYALRLFTAKTGLSVRRRRAVFVNGRYPFACADPDAFTVGEGAAVLVRFAPEPPLCLPAGEAGQPVPAAFFPACVHTAAVTGRPCTLAVLVGESDLRVYALNPGGPSETPLMQAEADLMQAVVSGKEPARPAPEEEKAAPAAPAAEAPEGLPLYGMEPVLRDYADRAAGIRRLQSRQRAVAKEIRVKLGAHARGFCGDYRVTVARAARQSFDRAAFARAHPAILLDPYYRTVESETLRVTRV